ncbi:TLD-domain-containing protein [Bombardia bombarda]|uniref:Restriction of telomere capping protein 5 n=1 Tax=Bombardia bombarda TaxID=252184 RepID=A0AA39TWL4_9PEZI|nr:TLD-domain-containing protein [Bombardia bombarda]
MGQAHSAGGRPFPSREEVTKELATKFAEKCFTPLELFSLKDVFKNLADQEQHVHYLKEDTIARFLEIPDIVGASPVLFQMVSYIGAFPFLQDAPAVLGLEQTVMVITIMTERYNRVLAKGAADRRKLLFKSLAVYDRKLSAQGSEKGTAEAGKTKTQTGKTDTNTGTQPAGRALGFAIDKAGDDEEGDDDEDDELVLAALNSLDYVNVVKHRDAPTTHGAMVPADNFRKLIMLLLLVAPLDPQESLSLYMDRVTGTELESLRTAAESILAAFLNVEQSPGIKFHHFNTIIPASMPFIFNGLTALFEHFLFSKNLDFHKRIGGKPTQPDPLSKIPQPLLQDTGSIMSLNLLSQLSFFIPGTSLFRRTRLLYSGDDDGFSMGSFETKVFNWRAPTILLVRGTRLQDHRSTGAESSFLATLPPKRFPNGSSGDRVTFGAYISQPWKHTHRECFGSEDTLLFQLEPVHDVFRASAVNKDYVTFVKPSAAVAAGHAGISLGCPPPQPSFEFGCFTHDYTSRGGAFQTSMARRFNFQDRFEVTSLEVWGAGGDAEAKHQAEQWAWEAREAEARRRINLGTGDIEADRALLEMAGLIGQNRSGGSMG